MRRVFAVAGGVWLLIDLLRVWAPSLITVFGQAASTPAELMGGFALACVLAGTLPALLVRVGVPGMLVLRATLVLALVCRVGLMLVDGGQPQLWLASVGVAAAVAWTIMASQCLGRELVQGYFTGIALAAVTHAALGTWGAVWRDDVWGWSVLAVQAVVVLATLREAESGRAPTRVAFAVLPSYLLVGIWAANPARGSVAEETVGPMVVVLAAMVAVLVVRLGPVRLELVRRATPLAAGVVTLATALVLLPDNAPAWFLVAHALGMPALAVLLLGIGTVSGTGPRTGLAAAGGALVWVLLLFVYYAGYDLGYRADLVLVLLGIGLAALTVTSGSSQDAGAAPGSGEEKTPGPAPTATPGGVRASAGTTAVAMLLALFGPWITTPALMDGDSIAGGGSDQGLRVLAWNLRMGYGMDGRFEPEEVARVIAEQRPDVVLLSEVDRAWLLNGGQDQLAILARLLDLEAHFGPAADAVWGDAILTNLPVTGVTSHPLDSFGAVTGAQVLSATVTKDGQAYEVLSTHIQPHPVDGDEDGALAQALVISGLALNLRGDNGNPVVLGGDFNLEPGDPSWDAITGSGLTDALAEARPLPTSPADRPGQQIDHIFTSPDLVATDPVAVPGTLSDHLAVVVTVRVAE